MGLLYDVIGIQDRTIDSAVPLTTRYLAALRTPCYAQCINGEPHVIGWAELSQAANDARARLGHKQGKPTLPATYTLVGDVRGPCAHAHRTLSGAYACWSADANGCSRQGGYTDRVPRAYTGRTDTVGRPLNETEQADWEALAGWRQR